jgi:UDP-N-acetylmuramoyl-tripeptide--D-alanyl-D-alanine ligase
VQALPEDGIAILNADDAWVSQFGDGRFGRDLGERAMYYGTAETAQVRATEIEEAGLDGVRFTVTAPGEQAVVRLQLMGRHNVLNALAAIAAGLAAGMPLGECAAAIEGLRAGDKRGEVIEWRGARVINDSYNSNPRALDAMVAALAATPVDAGARRIVIAGEMLELGPEGAVLHRACGAAMAAAGIDQVIGVRGLAASLVEGAGSGALFVETPKEAGAWMRANLRAGDVVLLKASRGVRLEQALGELADDAG